jgi:hypothetical protein
VTTPNSAGQLSDQFFHEQYVNVDQRQHWILFDETTPGENLGQVTSVDDWPPAWHVSVPQGKISLNIPNWRKGHMLKVRQGFNGSPISVENDFLSEGSYLVGTRYSLQDSPYFRTYSFHFVPALADGDPTQPFLVVDGDEVFDCGANERSPAEWYGPPEPLTLSLNASRWSHELYVRQFDGSQFLVQRSNLQGGWWINGSGQSVFHSFGIFEGLGWRQQLLQFAVFDRTTGELADANITALAAWGTDTTDTDGDGLYDWWEVLLGTIPTIADTDGDGDVDGADFFPLDPTRWAWASNSNDHTPPVITLTAPAGTTLTP